MNEIDALERALWELAVVLPEADYATLRQLAADLRSGALVRRDVVEAMQEEIAFLRKWIADASEVRKTPF